MSFSAGSRVAAAVFAIVLSAIAAAGPVEDSEQADQAYRNGDVVAAMALFRRAANEGHAPAQVRLAEILDAAEDDVAAVELYRKAAAQGSPAGEHGLATMYAKGEGVGKDYGEALKWYRLAAEKSYLPSVLVMARAYLTGDLGVTVNPDEAAVWGDRVVRLGGTKPTLAKPTPPKPDPKGGRK